MTIIEGRLAEQGAAAPAEAAQPPSYNGSNGSNHLLTLVETLDNELLNERQRQLVAKLRQGILALGD